FTRTAADDMILADKDPHYRVLNLSVDPWQDATTSYYHKSIGGYHGAKLKRIQELYENVMDKNINAVGTALNSQNDSIIQIALSRLATLNMLNTKYIIYNPEGGVLPNRYACGNAWFVKEIKIVQNSDEELKSLDTLSSKNTAVVEKSFSLAPASFAVDSAATIRLTSYGPNKLTYESNTSREQFAVFSEVYYDKGWNAYIDGNPVPHVRADFVLRALKVPAGKHNIEFRFEPKLYFVGEKVALAGSLLLFLSVIGAIFYEVRKMKKVKAKVPVTV
ncbi:MAG TPA: YfhO family protein, partial [Bacteroidia bacterium]|nr:YfhO family protein [Bacteroidia bacterium]